MSFYNIVYWWHIEVCCVFLIAMVFDACPGIHGNRNEMCIVYCKLCLPFIYITGYRINHKIFNNKTGTWQYLTTNNCVYATLNINCQSLCLKFKLFEC